MKKTKGLYRIVVQQEDMSWKDSGEGPFDSYGAAKEFLKNEVGMHSEIAGGHELTVSLSRVKINKRFSRETLCFSADLVANSIVVADIENTGNGGSHNYLWRSHFDRKRVTAWAMAQETEYPVEKLDQIVNNLLVQHTKNKAKGKR
jgi:hypothetical protein